MKFKFKYLSLPTKIVMLDIKSVPLVAVYKTHKYDQYKDTAF